MNNRRSRRLLILSLLVGMAVAPSAQAQQETQPQQTANILTALTRTAAGQGSVSIHQDARIAALVGNRVLPAEGEEPQTLKCAGYRIQVYAGGNTRVAKNEAYAVAEQLQESFPDLPVYTTFNPPRWLCRAGDFRSIEEADAVMRQLRATGEFKEVSIVREQVNIPL